MKGAAAKIAACAGSVALAFFGAELALRIAGYNPLEEALTGRVQLVRASLAPGRGYELVPGARGEGWGTEVAVNEQGFRGPGVALEAPDRVRIVALGDSVTFGNDLDWTLAWPAVLEHELAARALAVDVLNLGLGGYDTAQEVATLETLGLAFQPEQVIVGFCVNDLGVVSMSMETAFVAEDRRNPLFIARIAQWLHARGMERAQSRALFERNREANYALAFADQIDPLAPEIAGKAAALASALEHAPAADQDLATRRIPPRWFASPARLGRLQHVFARLADLGTRHGFGVTVLLIPYLEADPLIERGLDIVRFLAESFGFAVVAPRAEFEAAGLAHLRIREEDPVHPGALGHALMARALASHLQRVSSSRARPEPGE